MRFGVVSHAKNHRESNLGDDIQAIAARQFLPKVDLYLERESLDSHQEEVFAILNGWYMHSPDHFPPNLAVKPKITSIHISPFVAERMLNQITIEYFRSHEPIGCRDLYTMDLLNEHGVNAYFSSCLTLTLNRDDFATSEKGSGDILLVDPFYRYTPRGIMGLIKVPQYLIYTTIKRKRGINQLLTPDMQIRAKHLSHFLGVSRATFAERYQMAKQLLTEYANARLVITSRLHAALPCLAFGTPVLFVIENADDSRFSGNLDLLNVVTLSQVEQLHERGVFDIEDKHIKWNQLRNSSMHLTLRDQLADDVSNAVRQFSQPQTPSSTLGHSG